MIYFQNKSNQNRKILKWLKSKSKSLKNDLNRDLNHIRFKSPMILTTLLIDLKNPGLAKSLQFLILLALLNESFN